MKLHLIKKENGTNFKTMFDDMRSFVNAVPQTDVLCFTYKDSLSFLPEDSQELLNTFIATKLDILFSADTECLPWKHVMPLYTQTLSIYRYLNARGYIGKVAPLKTLFNSLDYTQSSCDQSFFTYMYINYLHDKGKPNPIRYIKIGLDTECRIFQTIDGAPWSDLYITKGRLYNKTERTTPYFLHTRQNTIILPLLSSYAKDITTDTVYSFPSKDTTTPIKKTTIEVIPVNPCDKEIIACAKEAAKRYICPDQERIHLRDQVNNHAIIQGTRFIQDVNESTMHVEFAKTNRRIIEQYFERIGSSNTLLLDISLHDYVGTHMNNSKWPHSVLGFSKFKDDQTNVLIPDLYAMQNYRGMLEANLSDNLPTQKKINKLFFIGSSYGPTNVDINARVRVCKFAQGKNWIEAYISKVINFEEKQLADYLHAPISMQEQYTYRHILVIDGNTVCWDRLPWVLASRSVCWKQDSDEECWYYAFLKPWVHYIPFTIDNLEETWNKVKDDYKLQQQIVRNANEFVEDFLTPHAHALYTKTLLDEIANLYISKSS